jgi:hypothetical protein
VEDKEVKQLACAGSFAVLLLKDGKVVWCKVDHSTEYVAIFLCCLQLHQAVSSLLMIRVHKATRHLPSSVSVRKRTRPKSHPSKKSPAPAVTSSCSPNKYDHEFIYYLFIYSTVLFQNLPVAVLALTPLRVAVLLSSSLGSGL